MKWAEGTALQKPRTNTPVETTFPKVTHEQITKIISNQVDIKLGQFALEELDSVLRKIKDW